LIFRRSLLTCFCSSVLGVALAELALEVLALNRCFLEALTEEVLGGVSAAVAAVTNHRHDHLLVDRVVGEHLLEAVRQIEELLVSAHLGLEDLGLDDVLGCTVNA